MSEVAFPWPEEQEVEPWCNEVQITLRDVDEIAKFHGMTLREFRGKTILDLGSGYNNLGANLADRGIDARVISVDLSIDAIQESEYIVCAPNTAVQARLEELPIASNSVDLAIASYSVPFWASSPEEITAFFAECRRVVKVGGMLSVFPMGIETRGPYHRNGHTWDEMRRHLRTEEAAFKESVDWFTMRMNKPRLLRAIKASRRD